MLILYISGCQSLYILVPTTQSEHLHVPTTYTNDLFVFLIKNVYFILHFYMYQIFLF